MSRLGRGRMLLIGLVLLRLIALFVLSVLAVFSNLIISLVLMTFAFVYFISLLGILGKKSWGAFLIVVLASFDVLVGFLTGDIFLAMINLAIIPLAIGEIRY